MNLVETLRAAFLERLTLIGVIDILIVAILIYQVVSNLRGRRAAQVTSGVLTLLVVYVLAQWFRLSLLLSIMEKLAPSFVFALIVLYQSEIRRILARIGKRRLVGFGDRLERAESAEEILLAMNHMAQNRIGALIVVEREIGLRSFIETGVPLDARLSRDLLLSIFYLNSPLHDGAVILQRDRAAAAACFLPLTLNPQLMNTVGTRHRAAIGITEETDCLALIVSEETGRMSFALQGEITSGVTLEELERQLTGRRSSRLKLRTPADVAVNRREAAQL
jgi:diadenylate cyclase